MPLTSSLQEANRGKSEFNAHEKAISNEIQELQRYYGSTSCSNCLTILSRCSSSEVASSHHREVSAAYGMQTECGPFL
jgi:hypothetical protein